MIFDNPFLVSQFVKELLLLLLFFTYKKVSFLDFFFMKGFYFLLGTLGFSV